MRMMYIGLCFFCSFADINMFSHAFELAKKLFCLLLLHGSSLESVSPVRVRGKE